MNYRWHETLWMIHHPWSFLIVAALASAALLVTKIRNR